MIATPYQHAACTALTLLAEELRDGGSPADLTALLTAAEMSCELAGLPEDRAPAVMVIASSWVAIVTGSLPSAAAWPEPAAGRNLSKLPESPSEQAGILELAARMIRQPEGGNTAGATRHHHRLSRAARRAWRSLSARTAGTPDPQQGERRS